MGKLRHKQFVFVINVIPYLPPPVHPPTPTPTLLKMLLPLPSLTPGETFVGGHEREGTREQHFPFFPPLPLCLLSRALNYASGGENGSDPSPAQRSRKVRNRRQLSLWGMKLRATEELGEAGIRENIGLFSLWLLRRISEFGNLGGASDE